MNDKHEEVKQAINSLTTAEREYEALLMQFFSFGHVVEGQPIPPPKRVLDIDGLKELEQAEKKKQLAQEHLKKLFDRYYPTQP